MQCECSAIACLCADQHQKGNIFTLFLHSPLMAFCHIVNIVDVPVSLWDRCLSVVDRFIADASRLLSRSRTLGRSQLLTYISCRLQESINSYHMSPSRPTGFLQCFDTVGLVI